MTLEVTGLSPVSQLAPAARPHAAADPAASSRPAEVAAIVDTMPTSPPADVWKDIQTANSKWHDLQEKQLNLRFSVEGRRVVVEMVDPTGQVVRRMPPGEAVDMASGIEA